VLKRATRTLWHCLDEMDRTWLPVVHSWRLNERHYGALQGLNKADMAKQYGDAQVLVWRRSYDTPPPALEPTTHAAKRGDIRYAKLKPEQVPLTECLKDTVARVMPFWNESMAPAIKQLASASWWPPTATPFAPWSSTWTTFPDADIVGLNIPNGIPLVYELDANSEAHSPLLPGRCRSSGQSRRRRGGAR
jgi:2,3-bisphosphoglycerate-dependent phosphoglycerate mutase